MSMRFDNFPTQERVSVPKHSRRFSGWSQTISWQTKFSRASVYAQRWCLRLSRPRFRNVGNEGTPGLSSTAQLSHHIEHIQIHPASGNAQDSGGTPLHRQTIPKTPDTYAGSPSPLLDADDRSYWNILHIVVTCVKWIPPLNNITHEPLAKLFFIGQKDLFDTPRWGGFYHFYFKVPSSIVF